MKPGLAQFHNLGQNRVSSNAAYYLVPMIYNAILMLVCVVDGVKAINSLIRHDRVRNGRAAVYSLLSNRQGLICTRIDDL